MTKEALVKCSKCGGSGKTKLTGKTAFILAALTKCKEEVNGADLAKMVGVRSTAANNRLVSLERLGLAKRRWSGRECLWRAV